MPLLYAIYMIWARGGISVNNFVGYYIESRTMDAKVENRQLLFAATVQAIASCGTIEDLQALTAYYQNEWEEINYETA